LKAISVELIIIRSVLVLETLMIIRGHFENFGNRQSEFTYMKLQFLFRLNWPLFRLVAGLTPDTRNLETL